MSTDILQKTLCGILPNDRENIWNILKRVVEINHFLLQHKLDLNPFFKLFHAACA